MHNLLSQCSPDKERRETGYRGAGLNELLGSLIYPKRLPPLLLSQCKLLLSDAVPCQGNGSSWKKEHGAELDSIRLAEPPVLNGHQ